MFDTKKKALFRYCFGSETRMYLTLDYPVAMFVERAADDEMCIYSCGVNNYLSFLFFFMF